MLATRHPRSSGADGARARRRLARGILVFLSLVGSAPTLAQAQDARRVEAAEALVERGAYGAAIDTLRVHLARQPRDRSARVLLPRLLYWDGEFEAARRAYGEALALWPDDPELLLGQAEVLVALEEFAAAERVLRRVLAAGGGAATEARARLGTLAYWRGDHSAAVRQLEAVLSVDPDHAGARRQLAELRALSRPWIESRGEMVDDSQPYRRGHGELEAGVFLTPLWTLSAGVAPQALDPSAAPTPVAAEPRASGSAWLELGGYLPALRLDAAARGGAAWGGVAWGGSSSVTAMGSARLTARLGGSVSLGVEGERERYTATAAAADTLLMVEALRLRLERSTAEGLAFAAVGQVERFPDANRIRTGYAWLLVPLVPHLRAGYAFSWQDSDVTRWDSTGTTGVYDPYFTPEDLVVHAALAELALDLGRAGLTLSGSYGLNATTTETASTGFTRPGPGGTFGPPRSDPVSLQYAPWRLSALLNVPGDRVSVRIRGERERTAFYAVSRLSASLVYTVGGGGQ